MVTHRAVHLASLMLVILIWGLSFVFIKIGVSELPVATLALLRFFLASVVLLAICVIVGERLRPVSRHDLLRISALGLSGVTLVYILEFSALNYLTAGLGSVLASTTAIFIAVFSVSFLKERLRNIQVMGLIIGFVGVILLVSNGELLTGSWDILILFGSFLMLMSAFVWAAYSIWVKKMMRDFTPLALTTLVFVMGTIFLIPFSVAEWPWEALALVSWEGWASVLYLAIPSSVVAYFLYNRTIKVLPATTVGALLYLIPVWGVFFDTILLETPLTWVIIVGGAFVIGGVALVEISSGERRNQLSGNKT